MARQQAMVQGITGHGIPMGIPASTAPLLLLPAPELLPLLLLPAPELLPLPLLPASLPATGPLLLELLLPELLLPARAPLLLLELPPPELLLPAGPLPDEPPAPFDVGTPLLLADPERLGPGAAGDPGPSIPLHAAIAATPADITKQSLDVLMVGASRPSDFVQR